MEAHLGRKQGREFRKVENIHKVEIQVSWPCAGSDPGTWDAVLATPLTSSVTVGKPFFPFEPMLLTYRMSI